MRSARRLLHQKAAKIAVTLGGWPGARSPVCGNRGEVHSLPSLSLTCGKDSGARIPSTSCLLSLPYGVLGEGESGKPGDSGQGIEWQGAVAVLSHG